MRKVKKDKKVSKEWKKVDVFPPVVDLRTVKEIQGKLLEVKTIGENKSTLYTFEGSDGKQFSVWGSANLDSQMKNISIFNDVRIVFTGESNTRAGRTVKTFDVYWR